MIFNIGIGMFFCSMLFIVNLTKLELAFVLGTMRLQHILLY